MRLGELSYISNLLSITRIILAAPIYYFLNLQTTVGNYLTVVVMLLAAVTDAFDGRLARKLHQKSDLGRVLDPVADKITMGMVAFMLWKTHDLPLWFLLLVLGRDLAIMLLALLLTVRTRVVVESNIMGKVTVCVLAVTVIAYTLDISSRKEIFLWVSTAMLVASAAIYFQKMVKMTGRPAKA